MPGEQRPPRPEDVPLIENLVQSSLDLGWTTCSTASWSFTRAWSVRDVRYRGDYISVNCSASPVEFELSWSSVATHRHLIPRHGVSLYPAGTVVHRSAGGAMNVRALTLDRAFVARLLDVAADDLHFRQIVGHPDPQLAGFAEILAGEARRKAGDRLFLDSIVTAIAHHVRRAYGRLQGADAAIGGLPAFKRRRLMDHIESKLSSALSLTELAGDLGLSPSHLVRACRASFGVTPRQLVIGRRVERAKALLVHTDAPLDEIAKRVGFAHASHLVRAFSRRVGTTPGRYRRHHRIRPAFVDTAPFGDGEPGHQAAG